MNVLREKHAQEVEKILANYPPDRPRSAVMPLLHLAQRERGYLTPENLADVAEICEMTVTEVNAVVGFYTLYHDRPTGMYHIQVCTDLPCALRGADAFLKALCEKLGLKVGEVSPDGAFVIEEVKCLAACHRAPMFQVQGGGDIAYHELQTVDTAVAAIEELRAKFNAREVKQ